MDRDAMARLAEKRGGRGGYIKPGGKFSPAQADLANAADAFPAAAQAAFGTLRGAVSRLKKAAVAAKGLEDEIRELDVLLKELEDALAAFDDPVSRMRGAVT